MPTTEAMMLPTPIGEALDEYDWSAGNLRVYVLLSTVDDRIEPFAERQVSTRLQ